MSDAMAEHSRESRSSLRILIVDDEPMLRDILSQTLADYDVAVASDGSMAIDMLNRGHYPMVITDLMMPHVDGFTVLRTAKRIHPATAVLIITGYPSPENIRRCRELGCAEIMTKPFTVAAVRAVVDRCLRLTGAKDADGSS